jgi:hypothetical protein
MALQWNRHKSASHETKAADSSSAADGIGTIDMSDTVKEDAAQNLRNNRTAMNREAPEAEPSELGTPFAVIGEAENGPTDGKF